VEVETRLVELEYVSEACIVSIPDKDASTRIAAVIRFQPGCYKDLSTVREALSDKLSQYKLPTAMRVLQPDEEIPATVIGKVIRRKVVQRYFPSTGSYELPPGVETWDINQKSSQPKPWDWAGLQGC
jgi:malonyl-CoA/methylmalonyl-CoA synthetase